MTCTATLDLSVEEVDQLAATPEGEAFLDSEGYFRCDLAADHLGRHVALVDYLALDEDLPFTAPWLWWDEAQHDVAFGASCARCPLPEKHPAGSGCSAPCAQSCTSTVSISQEEAETLENLPHAVHQVEKNLRCQYPPGHSGDHVSLGQSQDYDPDTSTAWWITWASSRETGHEIKAMAECSATNGDVLCKHPADHPGSHWF